MRQIIFLISLWKILPFICGLPHLNSSISSFSGELCPGTAVFRCNAFDFNQEVLRFYINDTIVVEYHYRRTDTFPRRLTDLQLPYTYGQISSVEVVGNSLNFHDFTLQVSVSDLQQLAGLSLSCGSELQRSNNITFGKFTLITPATPMVLVMSLIGDSVVEVQAELANLVYPCSGMSIVYEVILKNATGSVFDSIVMEDCSGAKCHVTLEVSTTEYGIYFVEVTAIINGEQSVRGVPYISDAINTLSGQQLNVTFSPCFSSVTCEAESFGTCNVTFKNNFNNSIQISGQVNDKISLSNLQVDLRYNYSALYNSTFVSRGVIVVYDLSKYSDWNVSLIVVGVFLFVLSFVLLVIVIIIWYKKSRKSNFFSVAFILFWLLFVAINVVLWIVLAVLVSTQQDTCDTVWQSTRNNVIIASFVCAVVCVVMIILIAVIVLRAQTNSERPTINSEMTTMQNNESYEIHHNKKDFPLHQKADIYDYMN